MLGAGVGASSVLVGAMVSVGAGVSVMDRVDSRVLVWGGAGLGVDVPNIICCATFN